MHRVSVLIVLALAVMLTALMPVFSLACQTTTTSTTQITTTTTTYKPVVEAQATQRTPDPAIMTKPDPVSTATTTVRPKPRARVRPKVRERLPFTGLAINPFLFLAGGIALLALSAITGMKKHTVYANTDEKQRD